MPKINKRLLLTREAAEHVGLDISTIQRWARTGKLRAVEKVWDPERRAMMNLFRPEDVELAAKRVIYRLPKGDWRGVNMRVPAPIYSQIEKVAKEASQKIGRPVSFQSVISRLLILITEDDLRTVKREIIQEFKGAPIRWPVKGERPKKK